MLQSFLLKASKSTNVWSQARLTDGHKFGIVVHIADKIERGLQQSRQPQMLSLATTRRNEVTNSEPAKTGNLLSSLCCLSASSPHLAAPLRSL